MTKLNRDHWRTIIGARLKDIRLSQNQTIPEVAGVVGLSPSTIRKIEDGKTNWLLTTIVKLSTFYKIDLGELFEEDTHNHSTTHE